MNARYCTMYLSLNMQCITQRIWVDIANLSDIAFKSNFSLDTSPVFCVEREVYSSAEKPNNQKNGS